MGDRGNIAVIQSFGQVWFYTHWSGSSVKQVARDALASKAGRERRQDESYLTRIVFDHLVPRENHGEENGYGISTCIEDNEHPIIVVDVPKQRVFLILESQLTDRGQVPDDYEPTPGEEVWTFDEYIALAPRNEPVDA